MKEKTSSELSAPPLAFRIDDLARQGPLKRTSIFRAIRDRQLRARKFGDATVSLADDWRAFLESLPAAGERAA